MRMSRLIVGIALLHAAGLLFIFGEGEYSTAGVVAIAILGIISIPISRRGRGGNTL